VKYKGYDQSSLKLRVRLTRLREYEGCHMYYSVTYADSKP